MEEHREQPRPLASQPTLPQGYTLPPPPPPHYQTTTARPNGGNTFFRVVRLLFRRLAYGMIVVGRALRPIAIPLVIVLALLGVIGWMSFQLWGPKPGVQRDVRAAPIIPASAVENYIQGRRSFNAEMMWDSFSTDYQAAQLQRGASKATLQAQANNERLMGLQYVHTDYIGGVKTEDGGGMYFYSVDLSVQNQKIRLPIIFTSNADGKIENIISPLNNQTSSQ